MRKINLAEKLGQISDHWNPRIIAQLNGQHVKLVRFAGEFVWHHHEAEDELFLVVEGSFTMQWRRADGVEESIPLMAGELIVVPRGVEHRPVAEFEVSVLLFEPAGTRNTGNVDSSPLTVEIPDRL